ncbi:MAG: hypothetical protein K8R54_07270 [Bacteroidales bacterium]|nr:hypothetical protein [Bacteroidales bacterium]
MWTEPARQDLKDIFVFQSEFSHKSADKIINKIVIIINLLFSENNCLRQIHIALFISGKYIHYIVKCIFKEYELR